MNRFNPLLAGAVIATLSLSSAAIVRGDDAPATPPATAPAKPQPVEFRKLKAALPEKVASLERGEASGQRTKLGEVTLAQAEAPYGKDEGDNPKTAKITLMDYGDTELAKGAAGWVGADIDQESDNEYTKTTDVQGRRALVTYNSKDKTGSVHTLAGGRIIVVLDVSGLSDADFQKAIADVPLKALDALVTAK